MNRNISRRSSQHQPLNHHQPQIMVSQALPWIWFVPLSAQFWAQYLANTGLLLKGHRTIVKSDRKSHALEQLYIYRCHNAIHANHAVSLIQHVQGMLSYHRAGSNSISSKQQLCMLPSSDTGVAPLRKISAIFCGAQGATRPNYVDLVTQSFGWPSPPHPPVSRCLLTLVSPRRTLRVGGGTVS